MTIPYIKPENRMSPEENEELKDLEKHKPIIEMDFDRIMPVHMFIGELTISHPKMGKKDINLMMTILHDKKTDRLDVRGRYRFNDSGNKTVLGCKKDYAVYELEQAKAAVEELYKSFWKIPGVETTERDPKFTIDYAFGESFDSIVARMEATDKFNIGIVENPKKS